jgi:hypothetical protein
MGGWRPGSTMAFAAAVVALAGASAPGSALAAPAPSCAGATCTITYTSTGGEQRFTVPTGVSSIAIVAVGSAGAPAAGLVPRQGGLGGTASTSGVPVSAGQQLFVEVGGTGIGGSVPGFYGGGLGFGTAGNGGGASGLQSCSRSTPGCGANTTMGRWLVAGGGGGGTSVYSGGDADHGAYVQNPFGTGGDPGQPGQWAGNLGGAGGAAGSGGGGGGGNYLGTGGGGGAGGPAGGGGGGGGGAGGGAGNYTLGGDGGAGGSAGGAGGNGANVAANGGKGGTAGFGGNGALPLNGDYGGAGGGGGYYGGGGGGGGGGAAGGGGGSSFCGVGSCGGFATSTQTASVKISYTNPVQAHPATYLTTYGTTLTVPAAGGLLSPGVGRGTSASASTTPSHGAAIVRPDGSFSYIPSAGFVGTDSFVYQVVDDSGDAAAATVTVTVSATAPGAPAAPVASAGAGEASVAFGSPSDTGGAPVSGYVVTAWPGGQSATGTGSPITVTGLTPGNTYTFTVAATNPAGTGPASAPSAPVTLELPPPVDPIQPPAVAPPVAPPVGGASPTTPTAPGAYQGTGSAPFPAPPSGAAAPGCPAGSGTARGTRLGPLKLGMTRAQAERALPQSTKRATTSEERFCLTPAGLTVGYSSSKVLATLPARDRARYRTTKVVWISTTSAKYTLAGVRPGRKLTAATRRRLKLGKAVTIEHDRWYLAPHGSVTAILGTHAGSVTTIAIALPQLAHTHTAQRALLRAIA